MSPMLIAILTWAATAACGANERRAVDRLATTPAARMAEFSNRDNRLHRREGRFASCWPFSTYDAPLF